MASITSGVTRMRNTVPMKILAHRPGRRAKATPLSPPRTTAITVAPKAAMNELRMASPIPAKSKIFRNQSLTNPLTTRARTKPPGPTQLRRRGVMSVVRAKTRLTTNASAVMTTNLSATAQAAPPSKSSPHHFVLVSPDQMENDEPPLNE